MTVRQQGRTASGRRRPVITGPWIYDTFSTADTSKWSSITAPGVTVSAGAVQISATPTYPSITSTRTFDLTGNAFTAGIEQLPNVGTGSTQANFEVLVDDANRWVFGWTNNSAALERYIGGVKTAEYGTYLAGAAAWRVRHVAPNVVFEMSTNGTTWTQLFSRPATDLPAITAVKVCLRAGNWNNETTPGSVRFTEVSIALPDGQPNPVWSEEFDTLDLASSTNPNGLWRANDVWQNVDQGHAAFDGATPAVWNLNPNQTIAGAKRSPFSIADSVLTITAQRTPAAWQADIAALNGGYVPPWSSGLLISNTNRTDARFGYGYYEFRARMPAPAKGYWPALWFFAANGQNPGKTNAEIDLIEVFGYATGQPWSITLHQKTIVNGNTVPAAGATTGNGEVYVATISSDTTGWHTYGLDWQASYLRFYKDGAQVAEVTGANATFFNGVSMGIRFDVAMDGSWFPAAQTSDGTTPNTLTMDVDYVRRWNTKP